MSYSHYLDLISIGLSAFAAYWFFRAFKTSKEIEGIHERARATLLQCRILEAKLEGQAKLFNALLKHDPNSLELNTLDDHQA